MNFLHVHIGSSCLMLLLCDASPMWCLSNTVLHLSKLQGESLLRLMAHCKCNTWHCNTVLLIMDRSSDPCSMHSTHALWALACVF